MLLLNIFGDIIELYNRWLYFSSWSKVWGLIILGCHQSSAWRLLWFGKRFIIITVFQPMGLTSSKRFISCNSCFFCSWSWSSRLVALWVLKYMDVHLHPHEGLFPATGNIHLNGSWVWSFSLWVNHCEYMDISASLKNHWVKCSND